VEGGTMAWERGKRKRREGSESDEGLGNAAVKVVVVENRRMVNREQDKEMALAISHLQIRVFRGRVLPVQLIRFPPFYGGISEI